MLPATKWSGTSILNIPIGQGVGVTLTQLTRAYAAIANGGLLVTPHVIASVGGQPGSPGRAADHERRDGAPRSTGCCARSCPSTAPATARQGEGLRAWPARPAPPRRSTPRPASTATPLYTSSFVGYAPAENPQLLVAVVVDEPTTGSYYGGDVAAPAFEEIAEFSLQTLRIAALSRAGGLW